MADTGNDPAAESVRMMLYIDHPLPIPLDHPTAPRCFRGREAAHLFADSEEELLRYALSIGMEAAWLQRSGTIWAHFDLTGRRLKRVLRDKRRVISISRGQLAQMIRKRESLCL